MPTYLLRSTQDALGGRFAPDCDSRALYLNRCAVPDAKDDKDHSPRKLWFERLISTKAVALPADRLSWLPASASQLHARLISRLMVGMTGGVMENAHLTLDRYGLPVLSGNAVKGCARRAALAALREWCESGQKPSGHENLLSPLCTEDLLTPSDLLVRTALVFGWVESDWEIEEEGASLSDLAWACGTTFTNVWKTAAEELAARLGVSVRADHVQTPWRSLPGSAGSIAFLQATPSRDPGLVLDVITCHHGEYYEGEAPDRVATDHEEPVPVFFPAVREQSGMDHFTFILMPLRRADDTLLTFARTALRTGLEVFGIGAKTNAGYGVFDASETTHHEIATGIKQRREEERRQLREKDEQAAREREAEARRSAKAALEQALAGLSPEQQEDKKLELLTEAQFDAKMRAFCKDPKKGGPGELEKQAIIRALRGPRLAYWTLFKTKATKGELATVDQAVRSLCKTLNLGKMP